MMAHLFNPNDRLGRHPRVCLVLLLALYLLASSI